MKENGPKTQQHEIIREWRTREINPQEIAEALRGDLKKSTNNDSRWEIDFNNGGPNPLFTLTVDPDKRDMFFHVNAPSDDANRACRFGFRFSNIEDLHFMEYRSTVTGLVETDMAVNVRDSGSGLSSAHMGASSYIHKDIF